MAVNRKNVEPAKPVGLELIFLYRCPYCGKEAPLLAPSSPAMVRCDVCENQFPIVPIDERSVYFVKIMLHNGMAAVDPDFL